MQLSDVQQLEAVPDDRVPGETGWRPAASRWRLVLLSFLMLCTALALIRSTTANDVYLAYVTNFVLLASFLGIGVGFLLVARGATCRAGRPWPWRCWWPSCSSSRC